MAEKEKISHKLLLHPGEGELTAQRVAEQFNPHQVLVEKQRGEPWALLPAPDFGQGASCSPLLWAAEGAHIEMGACACPARCAQEQAVPACQFQPWQF